MEVHAHTHTARKKWTHSLWEFIMLFLAVTLGFFVENQREHMIEHQRERQFMKSMVEDLQKDNLTLENESKRVLTQYEGLDSLTKIIYDGAPDRLLVKKMYELQRKYLSPITLRLINRTELQLKNAGGMRLIRNSRVADSIIYYWGITELLYETKENINGHRIKAKDISFNIFSNKYYNHTEGFSFDTFMGEPELMTNNPVMLSEFANRVSHMSDLLKFNYKQGRVDRQAENAIRLIQLINKEYHFK